MRTSRKDTTSKKNLFFLYILRGSPSGLPLLLYICNRTSNKNARFFGKNTFMKEPDKDIIVSKLRSRDDSAITELFDAFYENLYLFAEKFIYDKDKAHDLVQDVFVKIWEDSSKIEFDKSVRYYLFTSVKNKCLNYLRKLKIEDKNNRKYLEAYIDSHTVGMIDNDELIGTIKSIIEDLPQQCRYIYKLRVFYGYKYREIAEDLGVSESTVKVQISRANAKIRENILKDSSDISILIFTAFMNL